MIERFKRWIDKRTMDTDWICNVYCTFLEFCLCAVFIWWGFLQEAQWAEEKRLHPPVYHYVVGIGRQVWFEYDSTNVPIKWPRRDWYEFDFPVKRIDLIGFPLILSSNWQSDEYQQKLPIETQQNESK